MTLLINSVVTLGIVICWTIALNALRSLRHTTLFTAWLWSIVALVIWSMTMITDGMLSALSRPAADHTWYACAVFSLCPPIAVLGSRRPGARVWTWFILLPMLLVLGWPVGSLWLQGTELRGVQLENPQLAAFCLVLIMGIGNYCGTSYTVPALLYGISVASVVTSMSATSPAWLHDRTATRCWCSCLMVVAIGLTGTGKRPIAKSNLDQLWFDFFDGFGIVWGRRIQDRVNYQLGREALPVRLELDGFHWTANPDQSDSPTNSEELAHKPNSAPAPRPEVSSSNSSNQERRQSEERIEQILRWLLRRFVDYRWIDQRLKSNSATTVPALPIDS